MFNLLSKCITQGQLYGWANSDCFGGSKFVELTITEAFFFLLVLGFFLGLFGVFLNKHVFLSSPVF